MKKLSFLIATALCIMACSGGSDEQPDGPGNGNGNGGGGSTSSPVSSSNPAVGKQLPDPTIIHMASGNFYLYVTQQDSIYTPIYKSTNVTQWIHVGTAFLQRPNWQSDTRLWAPDINYINGKYVLYYTLGHWGLLKNSCIGVAANDSPVGPFTDHGKLPDYDSGIIQCIDPCYFEDNGKEYLFWGNYNSTSKGYEGGTRYVELSADGLSIGGAVSEKIIGPSIEGIMIRKRGNYYYLLGLMGSYCKEERGTYRVVVGCSKNIEGPYVGKNGTMMEENSSYNEVILQGDNLFTRTEHNSEIVTDDKGNDRFSYHIWQRVKVNNGCQLMCDHIQWGSNGWSCIINGTPTSVSRAPVFKNEGEKEQLTRLFNYLLAGILCASVIAVPVQHWVDPQKLASPEPFSTILLGDPRGYTKYDINQLLFDLCTAWITDDIEPLEIKAVLCMGDLVEQSDNSVLNRKMLNQTSCKMWEAASQALKRLDNKVPYITAASNYDYGYKVIENGCTYFPDYIPFKHNSVWRDIRVSEFPNRKGGVPSENSVSEFDEPGWGGILVIAVEFVPRDEVLQWAKGSVSKPEYKSHKVIFITHSCLNIGNKRVTKNGYKISPQDSGRAIWGKLICPSSNIHLVPCGHVERDTGEYENNVAYWADKNSAGKGVSQMTFNVQYVGGGSEGNGGDGWPRILKFMPDGRAIKVHTYSPLFGISKLARHLAHRMAPYDQSDIILE